MEVDAAVCILLFKRIPSVGKKNYHRKTVVWFVVWNCCVHFMTWEPFLLMLTSLTLRKLPCRPVVFILIGWGRRTRREGSEWGNPGVPFCRWAGGEEHSPWHSQGPRSALTKTTDLLSILFIFGIIRTYVRGGCWAFFPKLDIKLFPPLP